MRAGEASTACILGAIVGALAFVAGCSSDSPSIDGAVDHPSEGGVDQPSDGGDGGGDDAIADGATDVATDGATDHDGDGGSSLPNVPDNVAIAPAAVCTMDGIGATKLMADAAVTILEVSTGSTGSAMPDAGQAGKPYCLVKVLVAPMVNIWVAMPMMSWNGRLRAEGGGGYSGGLAVPTDSVEQDFAGIRTDTGHATGLVDGSFGMLAPGVPNTQLQVDFAYRSEHLMAVIAKQLVQAFYGKPPLRSYWFGCSTGGRQGLMMAQRYPEDYDAILAGAPAIHWDRFQAYQIWPQMVMNLDVGAPIAMAKLALATQKAIASCDAVDGLLDGLIDDPRKCLYSPSADTTVTSAACTTADTTCLTSAEAMAIEKIWGGARTSTGTLLWPGLEPGADLNGLAGAMPFPIATEQPKYWVYFDPNWDWKTLSYQNYGAFFDKTVQLVGPVIATDNPDLSAFAARGGKLLLFHGWADPLIMPEGTTRYFEAVVRTLGTSADEFAKLFMVPGMAHCSGGPGPNRFGLAPVGQGDPTDPEHNIFRALMAWSERDVEPQKIIATKYTGDVPAMGVVRTRPLCSYPTVARYKGSGSIDDAANFSCVTAR